MGEGSERLLLGMHTTPGSGRQLTGEKEENAAFGMGRQSDWKSQPPEAGLQAPPQSLKSGFRP